MSEAEHATYTRWQINPNAIPPISGRVASPPRVREVPSMLPAISEVALEPRRHVSSFLHWGGSRRHVNQSAARVARSLDPEFTWIEFGRRSNPRKEDTAAIPRGVAKSHVIWAPAVNAFPTEPEQLRQAVRTIVRGTDDSPEVRDLLAFLQLPKIVGEIAGSLDTDAGVRVVVLADADQVAGLRPWVAGSPGPIIGVLNRMGVTPVLTWTGVPERTPSEFEYIIRAPGPDSPVGPKGPEVCEWTHPKGPCLLSTIFGRSEIICRYRLPADQASRFPQGAPEVCPARLRREGDETPA